MIALATIEQALAADVKPALGCTEPVAIALAVRHATLQAGGAVTALRVRLSTNVFKNALEVGIPGTGGARGIPLAAALGAVVPVAQPDLGLLAGIDPAIHRAALDLVERGAVSVEIDREHAGLYLEAWAEGPGGIGRAVIAGSHQHLALLERNGEVVRRDSPGTGVESAADPVLALRRELAAAPVAELVAHLPALSPSTRAALRHGVDLNRRVAEAGLREAGSLGIGQHYRHLIDDGWLGNDVVNQAKLLTSAAVDARMSGCDLPVMTSAGSGNQGLTITLPLAVMAEHRGLLDSDRFAESLALGHLITSIMKHHTGTLSAMCGCAICAGTGLTAAVAWLLGGDLAAIGAAVNSMVGSVTGVICDGAKVGCAIKLVCAVDAAFQAALMANRGFRLPVTNGVLGGTIEQSLANVGRIASPGMLDTDDQIVAIMIGRPGSAGANGRDAAVG